MATLPFLIWRLFDEERFLAPNLPGYTEYQQKVRHRLMPRNLVGCRILSPQPQPSALSPEPLSPEFFANSYPPYPPYPAYQTQSGVILGHT